MMMIEKVDVAPTKSLSKLISPVSYHIPYPYHHFKSILEKEYLLELLFKSNTTLTI